MTTCLSVYYCILIGAIMTSTVDINIIHKKYDLKPFDRAILFFHQLVIVYMLFGTTFITRHETITHLTASILLMALWNYHGHCILSMYMENSIQYTGEDYDTIIMKYPKRRKFHLGFFLPILAIDVIKLLVLQD
jgi:hypothetical protein